LNLTVFYERIDACLNGPLESLLDLGCGTGLELERLLKRNPRLKLTAIDLSGEMLVRLSKKFNAYPLEHPIELIQGSFFDISYTAEFDCVLSTYALHHFSESDKLQLYTRIHRALRPGGRFVFGDYIASSIEQQQQFLAENQHLRQARGLPAGDFYHFDTPLTRVNEIRLMRQAGFTDIELIAEWDNTVIIVARK
jgi:ubiquinone/menaquinone biosynthesis C-methylase UbiE